MADKLTKTAKNVTSGADSDTAGNSAKLREALVAVKKSIDDIGASSLDGDPEILMMSLTQVCARLSARIDAALSAPPRNCDRFATLPDALAAWRDVDPREAGTFDEWLFAPATEKEGANDGR